MNHEITVTCPMCGEEYDTRVRWGICPACGFDMEKLSLHRLEQLATLQQK